MTLDLGNREADVEFLVCAATDDGKYSNPYGSSGVASGRAGRAQHDLNTQIKMQFSFQSELCPKNRATRQKIFLVSL